MDRPTGHGRIELRGVRALGTHGVLPEEQDRAQPFEVDVDAWLDVARAARTDALDATVDYGGLVAVVTGVVGGPSAQLLETLADRIVRLVLRSDRRIRSAAATVRKLRPPIAVELSSVAVAVHRSRAFLGLGSNLGDRRAHLAGAVERIERHGDLESVSPVYETQPVGGPPQGLYLNLVVELLTADGPFELLDRCRRLEAAAGRVRTVRFGPRSLDADVLLVGEERVADPELQVPHPRMSERRFVMAPLADLAPELAGAEQVAAASGEVVRLGML